MSLSGKVAIITGASSGIGAATAILFATEGCSLALTGRNVTNLENVKIECLKRGLPESKIILTIGDVTDHQLLSQMVTTTVEKFSNIDILVNNAGIVEYAPVVDSSMAQVEQIFATNFKAPIKLVQLCVPHLKKVKGNIVNVSSNLALRPTALAPLYCASKAALNSVSDCLAVELAPDIRVNSICPGGTKTAIFSRGESSQLAREAIDNKFESMVAELTPLGRMGDPIEIADAILFLASDKAKYITGEKLVVDGGFLCGKKEK